MWDGNWKIEIEKWYAAKQIPPLRGRRSRSQAEEKAGRFGRDENYCVALMSELKLRPPASAVNQAGRLWGMDQCCRDPSTASRKKRGSSVGMTG
jgi:hypothetical protein